MHRSVVGDDLFSVAPMPPSRSGNLSPKRPPTETAGMADIFPYYAGFSFEWARNELLVQSHQNGQAVVLDPWNGSGTTTLAAHRVGLRSLGVDLNPVANLVAQLRLSAPDAFVLCPPPPKANQSMENEPLLAWFTKRTAGRLRAWVDAISTGPSPLSVIAVFRVVRDLTRSFQSSNPTWIKRAAGPHDLCYLPPRDLDRRILREQKSLVARLSQEPKFETETSIIAGSSRALPIESASVDIVVTSPPYLTRIDYAVAYARELAVLGINIESNRTLREDLMGTTLIRKQDARLNRSFGAVASLLVEQVANHHSKASRGYYLKQVCQYLDDLTKGLEEVTRACRSRAAMVLVVQDSYYKDVPVLLANICADEAKRLDWQLVDEQPFAVTRTLTTLNRAAMAYGKGQVSETVLRFRKG